MNFKRILSLATLATLGFAAGCVTPPAPTSAPVSAPAPGIISAVPSPKQPIGEIVNPSFELLEGNAPAHWSTDANGLPVGARGAGGGVSYSSDVAHAGARGLVLSGSGRLTNRTLVKPYATYKLSGWIKTEDLPTTGGRGATFTVRGNAGVTVTAPAPLLSGTKDWTPVELTFKTVGQDSVLVDATIGGAGGRGGRGGRGRGAAAPAPPLQGKAYFDDLKLELVSGPEPKPSITIDLSKTREAMPDLIYGQFIEHLGRSIYGGIWAEMLEDRKFWYPVNRTVEAAAQGGARGARGGNRGGGARGAVGGPGQILFRPIAASPWMIVGGEGAVTMITDHPYVGEHTPQVDLGDGKDPKGISQNGLAVIAGKGYEGRVILAGDASAAPIEVSLIWGHGGRDRQIVKIDKITSEYAKYPIRFKAGATTNSATLQIVGRGKGKFMIGTASIMPDDNVSGMRKDTLAALKQLNASIYRWPGGNFVSGYDWKDGLGDRDKRPPRKNPAWTGVEHNDFGIHEYFEFLKEVDAQPFIALNAGLGSADQAAQEVEYVNGGPETPMGRLRAQNGHPAPFHCTYWAVGNEMSGSWQLGAVGIEEFMQRNNDFVKRVRAIDPNVKLVASGEATNMNVNNWDTQLLTNSADYMDLISKHFYMQDYASPGGLLSHGRLIPDSIRRVANSFREYQRTIPQMQGKNIKVSLDEWNYWYGPHVFGELGTRYFLRDALGIAAGLNEYTRDTDVIGLATYAQTVNVIGAIKTSKTAAVLDSTGEALAMYRAHFGDIPVEVAGAPEPLDIAATLSKDKTKLTISVVNMTYDPQQIAFKVQGKEIAASGKSWVLTGPDDMAYNDPTDGIKVKYDEKDVTDAKDTLEVAPCSATIFEFAVK